MWLGMGREGTKRVTSRRVGDENTLFRSLVNRKAIAAKLSYRDGRVSAKEKYMYKPTVPPTRHSSSSRALDPVVLSLSRSLVRAHLSKVMPSASSRMEE